MRHVIFCFFCLLLVCCGSESEEKKEQTVPKEKQAKVYKKRSLEEIKSSGVLRVSTTYSSTSYFLYKGKIMGFEYELLQRFAEHLGVRLEIEVANDIDNLIPNLINGKVDLMAHGLTVTAERKAQINFSDYIYLTKQVLVQKKPTNWRQMKWSSLERSIIHDAMDLLNDTVAIREETSYRERIENLSNELGGTIHIKKLDGSLTTDEIIKKVAKGELKYTIADENIAKIMASYYPILDISVPVSFSQKIAWATRKESTDLLNELNQWLKKSKKTVDYYVIYNKYFKNTRDFKKRTKSKFYSINSHKISKYDALIKKHAKKIGWDWRLVASIVYQESRFNPNAKSWAGAKGLMQIMPATAKELGVESRSDPNHSIEGGTKYLQYLYNKLDKIEDPVQRKKFAIASYNCGFYHVLDARNLAKKRGLNPTIWDQNVEDILLELNLKKNYSDPVVKYGYVNGIEPYNYVQEIFERYKHYQDFIPKGN
ncbi:membrane-bound lytic murein transglycosylase MltF [Flavicella marina]|uniref:membrane-bound lytic murein transglycosylase MltF n=1 Tax=Flavicella marina TaxID=1475951 RepID=UPI0012652E42|nr:membrane-bound lytic murein transglycosylase MltF [Flavicella marina]